VGIRILTKTHQLSGQTSVTFVSSGPGCDQADQFEEITANRLCLLLMVESAADKVLSPFDE